MINHKQANIPFSWEMIPGVPKLTPSSDKGVIGQKDNLAPPPPPPPPGSSRGARYEKKRVVIKKDILEEEDPFLAAFKECSKDNYKVKGGGDEMMNKKRFGIGNRISFLWCRCSFDVEDGNLIRRRPVPPPVPCGGSPVVPRERVQGLIRMHKGSRK